MIGLGRGGEIDRSACARRVSETGVADGAERERERAKSAKGLRRRGTRGEGSAGRVDGGGG